MTPITMTAITLQERQRMATIYQKSQLRFVHYYGQVAEQYQTDYRHLDREQENLFQFFAIALQVQALPLYAQTLNCLYPYLEVRGLFNSTQRLFQGLLQSNNVTAVIEPAVLAATYIHFSTLLAKSSDLPAAREFAESGLQLAMVPYNAQNHAAACLQLGRVTILGVLATVQANDEQAIIYLNEALALAEQLHTPVALADTQVGWGKLYLKRQQFVQAVSAYQAALTAAQPLGLPDIVGDALFGLAQATWGLGEEQQARAFAIQSLQLLEAVQLPTAQEVCHWLQALPVGAVNSTI